MEPVDYEISHTGLESVSKKRHLPWRETIVLIGLLLCCCGLFAHLGAAPAPQVQMAGFATSLAERTPGQQHNARRSAAAIDGKVIPPGGEFSFNKTVKSWSSDAGYVKAPVSYDGDLIRAYGGGVCQTSTTLYNAALLAGMQILERHPHAIAPHYITPGRDAAVAQYDVDLRFRNPYAWPVRISATADDARLDVQLIGARLPDQRVDIESRLLASVEPRRLTRVVYSADSGIRPYLRNPGAPGCRMVTYRIFSKNGIEVRRERMGDDTYQSMNRIVQVTDEP